MTKKKPAKPRRNPVKRKVKEDTNQIAYRVMQEIIRRSEA
jgi:hypothetical protein